MKNKADGVKPSAQSKRKSRPTGEDTTPVSNHACTVSSNSSVPRDNATDPDCFSHSLAKENRRPSLNVKMSTTAQFKIPAKTYIKREREKGPEKRPTDISEKKGHFPSGSDGELPDLGKFGKDR